MNTIWTPQLEAEAIRILTIIETEVKERRLPRAVYEAFVRTHKKISTELVLYNEKGKIWLIRRPSKDINPDDPYAGEWHLPGVVHNAHETTAQAFDRLFRQEIGEGELDEHSEVKTFEIDDGRRGLYCALLHVCRLRMGMPHNEGDADFFAPSALPTPIVTFHKDVLIPEALKVINAAGF